MPTRLPVAAACVGFALMLGVTQFGFRAAEARQQRPAAQAGTQPEQPGTADMMRMHEQMMAELQAAQTKLDGLVSDMNAATGDAKVTALTAVVNELVRQHKAMHHHMGQMHQHMMGGHGMMMRR